MICVVVLPSSLTSNTIKLSYSPFHVGEIHRRDIFIYSRSPLSEPEWDLYFFIYICFVVGEITQGRSIIINSRSPLCLICLLFCGLLVLFQMTGRFTVGDILSTLVLPPMNRNLSLFDRILHPLILTLFLALKFVGLPWWWWCITVA